MDIEEIGCESMDCINDSRHSPMASSFEYCIKPLYSTKGGRFLALWVIINFSRTWVSNNWEQ
jgi:hypothetical protein